MVEGKEMKEEKKQEVIMQLAMALGIEKPHLKFEDVLDIATFFVDCIEKVQKTQEDN